MTETAKRATVGDEPESEALQIVELAWDTLARFIGDEAARTHARHAATKTLPPKIVEAIDALAGLTQSLAYRDGVLTALAHPIVQGQIVDVTHRPPSGRPASDAIGKEVLPELHIKGVKGAYQNIGKNQPNLVRGNNPHWDALLNWAAGEATVEEIRVAYERVAAAVAATARTVLAKPRFRLAQLTFGKVMALVDDMLSEPSAGAHEQYVVAALLTATVQQESAGLRVQTKALNASDLSSRSAGDIEILYRNKIQDALEVSANHFETKLGQATDSIREYGLSRVHIVAPGLVSGGYKSSLKPRVMSRCWILFHLRRR